MSVRQEHTSEEVKRLQRCLNDLVSVLALPAIWSGSQPFQIVHILLDALLDMLCLDFVYARLPDPAGGTPIEVLKIAPSADWMLPDEIHKTVNQWFGDDPQKWPSRLRASIGNEDISILSQRCGLHGEIGVIVAGSDRADFPGQIENLLLSVATNEAVIGLHEARLLLEQKRVAGELDRRVVQRTAELAAVNDDLRKEIAERHLAEEALLENELNSRLILHSIPGLVCTMSPTGELDRFNPQILEYFGKTPEELKGWATSDAVHPDDLPRVAAAFTHSITTGTPYDIEHRCRRADGVYRWFQARALPVRDTGGRITGWYVLLTDIEDRKRAEDAIRASEQELRRSQAFIAEGQRLARLGSFSWRVESGQITWSDQLYRIFEFEPGGLVTLERIGSRTHPEDLPLFVDMIERAQRAHSDLEYEHRLLMPNQSVKYLHLLAHGTRDQDGRLEYIGAVQDVTERRLAEEALTQARSDLAHVTRVTSLGVLTAAIAHEVNQPLSGIITNASTCLRMLAAVPPNVEGARETAKRTIRDGNRASELITRLRALFSKKESTTEPVDLNEAAQEVIALSLNELQRNRVILRPEFADDLPMVTGDRVQLQQVILNLLKNASDAMRAVNDRPRQLQIRTERGTDDHVQLTVQDAGVGLDPQAMDRLFQAFYTTKNGGMGIGLSVSRSIIERHHGRLWAEPNDGPGATFSFSIPPRQGGASDAE
jgi:PAS domain S-box-containing protein